MEDTNIKNGVQQGQQNQVRQQVQAGTINGTQQIQQGSVVSQQMQQQTQYSQVNGFVGNRANGVQGQVVGQVRPQVNNQVSGNIGFQGMNQVAGQYAGQVQTQQYQGQPQVQAQGQGQPQIKVQPQVQPQAQPKMNNQFSNPQNVGQNPMRNVNYAGNVGIYNGTENKVQQGQYSHVSGFVGSNVNGVQGQMGQVQSAGQVANNQGVKENAGSIAGTVEQAPSNQFFDKLFNSKPQQEPQHMSGYVGGYVEAPQEKVVRIGYNVEGTQASNLPATKVGFLQKVKQLLVPSEWTLPELRINLTKKEEKVLTEVHDFLFQEVTLKTFTDLFKFGKNKNNG